MAKKNLKLNIPTIISIIIVGLLAIALAIFLPFYLKENEEERTLFENTEIKIVAYGEEIGVFSLEEMLAVEGVEEKTFGAVYDTSSSEPVEKSYTGIELKALLSGLQIDLSGARMVTFKASDGMNKVYSQQDVVKSNNVYIAYKVEGLEFNTGIDPLAYMKTNEDGGPFVIIKVEDPYSQNRCKLLVEIVIT
ncbi:MAG: hypothetical protein GXY10_03945 [Clostridiales bacterium]|jgi:hypothetical protein|nr:hypothetical protein [Clostridiales bacterium]